MRLSLRLLAAARGRPFYVTTPIFYVNAAPHLGHVYSAVVADAAARVERLMFPEVHAVLVSGTDEHGTKIQRAAGEMPLQNYCDGISAKYQDVLREMEVSCSDFVRTTQDRHKKAVQHFWRTLESRGHLYKTTYCGWYSVSDETFVPESQLTDAVRDGQTVKISTESGHPVEWMEEENYMFRLSSFRTHLLQWLKNDGVITPNKYQQQLRDTLSESYLPDISVSRPSSRVHWAIRTPDDESQSVYVWLDALVNYLTATGYPDDDAMRAAGRLWPADLHVIGKDILKFHGIYWPAFLMAAGLHPPRRILCHAHWTVDGQKMSKSIGNVVDPRSTPGGTAALRYFLLREATMHSDANYSLTKLIRTVNSELADSLGNLVARCTRPALNPTSVWPAICRRQFGELRDTSAAKLVGLVQQLPETCRQHYSSYHYYKVADACVATLHAANAMFESERPWELRKRGPQERGDAVLHVTMETLRVVAIVLSPLAPSIAATLLDKLAVPISERTWSHAEQLSWDDIPELGIASKPIPADNVVVFPRIQDPPVAATTTAQPVSRKDKKKVRSS